MNNDELARRIEQAERIVAHYRAITNTPAKLPKWVELWQRVLKGEMTLRQAVDSGCKTDAEKK